VSSIQLTNAYRTRLLSLERRVSTQARSAWPTIETFDDTAWPERVGAIVTRAQTESVRATAGYMSALLRSNRKPGRVALDTSRYAGVSRDGRPITEALQTALVGVRAALKDGREPQVALSIGLSRGLRMAKFETMQAGRDALLDATDEDERFVGWQRAVAGTCAACMDLSGTSGPQFEVHPDCQCVPEPRMVPDNAELGRGLMAKATAWERPPKQVFRTEHANPLYKTKAVWGEGRYHSMTMDEALEIQLHPETGVGTSIIPDAVRLPQSLRVLSIDDMDDLPTVGRGAPLAGERLREVVLEQGYDAIRINTGSLNFGGDQLVVYRGL
jgi:hypothetical protein